MERMKSVLDGSYLVSPDGQVYSLKAEKFLCVQDNGHGYKVVNTRINGVKKQYYVHRLVAVAFVDNPNGYPEVNHKDENPANNRVDNLEWCTAKYNKNYGNRAKKFSISRGVPVRCVETNQVFHGVREASRVTGINASSISACCNGYRNTKTAGGFRWQYAKKVPCDIERGG